MTQNLAVDWDESFQDATSKFVDFGLKFLAFLAILIVGFIVAKIVAKLVDTILERVGFDKAVERGGIKQALARSRYDASDLVSKLVYYAILLLTLSMAFRQFGDNPVSDMLREVVEFLPKLLVAVIIVVVAAAIAKAVKDILTNVLSGTPYGKVLGTGASVVILFLGVVAALQQIGVAEFVTGAVLTAVLVTIAGVIIVGVGGGLVMPMSQVWQQWISKAQSEAGNVKSAAQQNQGAVSDTLQGYAQQAQSGTETGTTPGSTAI